MQVKGASIRTVLLAIENLAGKDGVKAVIETLSPASQKLLEGPILVSTFFPASLSSEIHLGIRQTIGNGNWAMNRKVGAEAASIDFKGVYKVFLRLTDYDATLDRLPGAFRQYNSQGEVRWIERGHESATFVISEIDGFNEGQWESIAGRLESVLLLCGAKSSHVALSHVGPTGCNGTLTWVR